MAVNSKFFSRRGLKRSRLGLIIGLFALGACSNQQLSQLPPWIQSPKQVPSQTQSTPPPAARPAAPQTAAPEVANPPTTQSGEVQQPDAAEEARLAALPKFNTAPGEVPEGIQSEDRFVAPPPPPVNPDVPRVAILLPLSGPAAKIGQSMLNAAQLAVFHFANKKFELLPHDTKGTPEGAAEAAALAIGDGASLILGPLLSSSVRAAAPAAQAAGVVVVAFSNDRSVAGDGVFAMGFLPSEEVTRVVSFARQKGVSRFAALAPDNEYGRRVIESMRRAAEGAGGVVTHVELYAPRTQDFDPIIKRLSNYEARRQSLLAQKAELEARDDDIARQALARLERLQTVGDLSFDGLLIADGGKNLQSIAALLPYYDIDPKRVRILGTGQWDVPGIGAEPGMVGGWFAAPAPEFRKDFMQQYREVYGALPPRLATLSYDATALAAVLTQVGGRVAAESLIVPQGFIGRDGIFRFRPEGTAERGLTVRQIFERETKVISNSPASFSSNLN